jgi:hypothetical protein
MTRDRPSQASASRYFHPVSESGIACDRTPLKKLQRTQDIATVPPEPLKDSSQTGDAGLAQDVAHQIRKAREIALLQRCLRDPLVLPPVSGVADALAQKLKIASAMRAEGSLESWAITETARPEVREWHCGAFRLSFGYQRADLEVHGPPVYPSLGAGGPGLAEETLYTASGMSAITTLVIALLEVHASITVLGIGAGYGETRELLERFRDRIRIAPPDGARAPRSAGTDAQIVWLDSAVPAGFDAAIRTASGPFDLAVVDTTCFWRDSSRIRRLLRWARERDVPLALVRSHAKLDCLGIEYGRMGSLVISWTRGAKHARMRDLVKEARNAVRLIGCAAVPAHFPPFTGDDDYLPCSAGRTASIIRATRRFACRLDASALRGSVARFQHGLYVTLAPRRDLRIRDVKRAVDSLCKALASAGLPVRHAGSFGFDFVAIEWFPDPVTRRNVIRIAPGDLPPRVIDAVADGIVRWFECQRAGVTLEQTSATVRSRKIVDATVATATGRSSR